MCEERFEIWWGKQRPSWAGLNAWDRVTMWENCRAAWYAAWADSDVDQLFRTYRQKKSREPFGPGKPAT